MKKCFLILVLIFTAAVALASGEERNIAGGEVPTAVLSQAENPVATPENTPLLATTTAGSSQICGTGHLSLKGNRNQQENLSETSRHTAPECGAAPQHPGKTEYEILLPRTRANDRYIYFLRRIII